MADARAEARASRSVVAEAGVDLAATERVVMPEHRSAGLFRNRAEVDDLVDRSVDVPFHDLRPFDLRLHQSHQKNAGADLEGEYYNQIIFGRSGSAIRKT